MATCAQLSGLQIGQLCILIWQIRLDGSLEATLGEEESTRPLFDITCGF